MIEWELYWIESRKSLHIENLCLPVDSKRSDLTADQFADPPAANKKLAEKWQLIFTENWGFDKPCGVTFFFPNLRISTLMM